MSAGPAPRKPSPRWKRIGEDEHELQFGEAKLRARLSEPAWRALYATLGAALGLDGPELVSESLGQSGDFAASCSGCGEERDEPHTWAACVARLREERANSLDLAIKLQMAADPYLETILDARVRAAAPSPAQNPPGDRGAGWCLTFTGNRFWVLDPRSGDIHVEDIAHNLGRLPRWGGSTRGLIGAPVGQHCVLGSRMVPPEHALAFLLHDAEEAFPPGDILRPVKESGHPGIAALLAIQAGVAHAIADRFGLEHGFEKRPEVKHVDDLLLAWEARDLMPPMPEDAHVRQLMLDLEAELPAEKYRPWTATQAERAFLERFAEITGYDVRASLERMAEEERLGELPRCEVCDKPIEEADLSSYDGYPLHEACAADDEPGRTEALARCEANGEPIEEDERFEGAKDPLMVVQDDHHG